MRILNYCTWRAFGSHFNHVVMVLGLDSGNPLAAGVEWSVNRARLTSGGGVTVSDASIVFSDVRRSPGEYSAEVSNANGNVTANLWSVSAV